MRAADHIVDFGPGPGVRGGEVVAAGDADTIAKRTAQRHRPVPLGQREDRSSDASGDCRRRTSRRPEAPHRRRPAQQPQERRRRDPARRVRLRHRRLAAPARARWSTTSSSKSLLTRAEWAARASPASTTASKGVDHLDKVIDIDQSPIGRTPRSNPGTYIKVFDEIRNLYTQLPESKRRGYKPGRFSFNVPGGRCEACEGNGSNRLEMDFLADVWVTCPVCEGPPLQPRDAAGDVSREEHRRRARDGRAAGARALREHPARSSTCCRRCTTSASTTSSSASRRRRSPAAKRSGSSWPASWCRNRTGKTLYLLDEPTTGLHFDDIELLLKVLHGFVDAGNTVLVVEHNLDVIKTADWVIDLGPGGRRRRRARSSAAARRRTSPRSPSRTPAGRSRRCLGVRTKPQASQQERRRNGKRRPRGHAHHRPRRPAAQPHAT